MISILDHIQYLIISHDCVVVPGFGAFLAQNEPAGRDAAGRWCPPYRMVSFNAGVCHDDGLLCASVARRAGVPYETAKAMVRNDVALLRQRLDACGRIELPRIGALETDGETLLFSPDAVSPIAAARYVGLRSFGQAVAAEQPEEDVVLHVDVRKRRSVRSWLKVAASAAVLIGFGFTLSTPVVINRDSMHYASISVPGLDRCGDEIGKVADTLRTLFCVAPDKTDGEAAVAKNIAAIVEQENRASAGEKSLIESPRVGMHYVIVASCDTRARAEKYVSRRPGHGLRIVHSDGRYRVYTYATASKDDAMGRKQQSSFAALHPDAWVYSCE